MTDTAITIRRSGSDDAVALEDLAALDSHHTLSAPVLVAEVDGSLHAAVSLRDGDVVADPFVDTTAARSLLLTRARQLRTARRARASFPRLALPRAA